MTRWPRLPRRGVGVDRRCVRVTWTGRSGRGDAAGGIRDIRGRPRGIRAGCFLIFEAADRVMDVPGRGKLMVDDY